MDKQALSKKSMSPLFKMAVLTGVKTAVLLHLRREDVNTRDDKGRTPLMLAVAKGHTEISRILLEAGADVALVDTDGNDALSLARGNGQSEIEEVLREYITACQKATTTGTTLHEESEIEAVFPLAKPILDKEDFDLTVWEADTDSAPPGTDPSCLAGVAMVQQQISYHVPIDTDDDWLDIDIDLPEVSSGRRGRKALDEDRLMLVRELILYGLQNSRIGFERIYAVTGTDELDAEFEANLLLVLNDLRIEVDDHPIWQDNMVVPEESVTDEQDGLTNDALAFLENLVSQADDLLNLYLKDMGSRKILSREEEIELGRAIEGGINESVGVVARSVPALAAFLKLAERVERGEMPLDAMVVQDGTDPDGDEDDFIALALNLPMSYLSNISRIRNIFGQMSGDPSRVSKLADAMNAELLALRLSAEFIERLCDIVGEKMADFDTQNLMITAMEKTNLAKKRLTEANLRLVISEAKRFNSSGVPLLDLIQEGNMGLLKAVDRFDYHRGFKFSTYAMWWIRQSIFRFIHEKGRLIRVPVHLADSLYKVNTLRDEIMSQTGQTPSPAEIAETLSMSQDKVSKILKVPHDPISFETASDDQFNVGDLEDTNAPNPEELAMFNCLRDSIEGCLDGLSPREAQVLRMRFGLGMDSEHTLEEVGQWYGVTRERIRQIEAKALNRLRHPSRSKKLRAFI